MKLVYTHSNASDYVLLIDDSPAGEFVRSAWEVSDKVWREFCDCSSPADDWESQGLEDSVEDYGEIVAERVGFELQSIDRQKWEGRCAFFRI